MWHVTSDQQGAQSTHTSPDLNKTEQEAPSSGGHPSNAPSEAPPWPQDTQLGRDSHHNPQGLLLQEPSRGSCSSQGLQVCLLHLFVVKASVRVESSSFSSTFVTGIYLACQWAGVTLLCTRQEQQNYPGPSGIPSRCHLPSLDMKDRERRKRSWSHHEDPVLLEGHKASKVLDPCKVRNIVQAASSSSHSTVWSNPLLYNSWHRGNTWPQIPF